MRPTRIRDLKMAKYIKFPTESLRDDFVKTVNNHRCGDGSYVYNGFVGTYGSDEVSYERENVRNFGEFGELIQMFRGRLT